MKLSIYEAGRITGVHRATLHRWIHNHRLKKQEVTGLVETDDIIALRGAQTRGRPSGRAYKNVSLSKVGDFGLTLERAIVMLAGVMKALSPHQRNWLKTAILQELDNLKLMEVAVESFETARDAVIETDQEKLWDAVVSRASLSPKVDFQSPAIKALGEEIKKNELRRQEASARLVPPVPSDTITNPSPSPGSHVPAAVSPSPS